MTKEEMLKAMFNACMVNLPLNGCDPSDIRITKKLEEFDEQVFQDKLVKYDMGKFSKLLFKYVLNILEDHLLNIDSFEGYTIKGNEENEYRLELLKSLQFLFNNQHIVTKNLRIGKNQTTHFAIKNDQLIYELENFLEQLFTKKFRCMLSDQKTEAALQRKKNSDWITRWIEEMELNAVSAGENFYASIDESQNYTTSDPSTEYTGDEIKRRIIKDFKWSHPIKPELNIETICSLIEEIEPRIKKRGRGNPGKNLFITLLGAELCDLIRINRFLMSETITEIDQLEVKYSDYGFIYDVLDFWTLIPTLEDNNTSTPEDYMSTTMKQGEKFIPRDYSTARKARFAKLKADLADFY